MRKWLRVSQEGHVVWVNVDHISTITEQRLIHRTGSAIRLSDGAVLTVDQKPHELWEQFEVE